MIDRDNHPYMTAQATMQGDPLRASCRACPRNCGSDSFCGVPHEPIIARTGLHLYEEPPISGTRGSGTVFFSGCNLRCVFCQNAAISRTDNVSEAAHPHAQNAALSNDQHAEIGTKHGVNAARATVRGKSPHNALSPVGKPFTIAELADAYRRLESLGAHNINLVTPSHYANVVKRSLACYRPHIPIVWNSSGYDRTQTIQQLAEDVNIWLPDLKYFDTRLSSAYSHCADYFDIASRALLAMRKTVADVYDSNDIMLSGMIVRHMILPSHADDSLRVLDWLHANLPDTKVSLMCQYTPCNDLSAFPQLRRKLTTYEYRRVLDHAQRLGMDGYSQDRSSAVKDFVPSWNAFV